MSRAFEKFGEQGCRKICRRTPGRNGPGSAGPGLRRREPPEGKELARGLDGSGERPRT